tara:strand:- start:2187 stop:4562 length:2376 start_codon:yes stop_codon:yes gene_type:complete
MFEMFECINVEVLNKLAKLTLSQYDFLMSKSTTKRHNEYDNKEEYTKVMNYCKAYKGDLELGRSGLKQNYYQLKGEFGRLQAGRPSIQRLFNGVRGMLCEGKMIDVDISNCHPQILYNLCKKYDIECNYLSEYIENRDEKLQELMSSYNLNRGQAKVQFLKCINKDSLSIKIGKKLVKNNSFFQKFDVQTSKIIKKLAKIYKKNERFSQWYEHKDYNTNGKFFNLVLQDMENNILGDAMKNVIARTNNDNNDWHRIGVLMFDGCMINKTNFKNELINYGNLIERLDNYFEDRGGYKWSIKPHTTELLQYLNEMELKSNRDFYIADDVISIVNHILLDPLKDKLVKCNGVIYFMNEHKIESNEKMIKYELFDFISEQDYYITNNVNGKDKRINVSKIPNHIKNIVEGLICKCQKNNNFISDVWDYTQYKLFFKNGYFDYKLNKFVSGIFNKTFIKINKNYEKSNNDKLRKEINNKIFDPIFTIDENQNVKERKQLLEYFKYTVGQYLAGNIELKRWTLLQGFRNSGKGIIGDLLKNAFEGYVMTTNSSNFSYKSNNTDSQKALSWLIDYEFVRIALTSEITISDDEKLDGNMIKKFTSGGDYIMARKNFQDEKEFKIQSGLIVCCNDCPKIEPNDALEFCDEIQMKSKFIDEDYDDVKFNGFNYYKKDNSLKSEFLKRNEIINEIINIFIESYYIQSEYPKELRRELQNNDDNEYLILKELFEFTKDPKDFIENKYLKDMLKNAQISFTLKKAKMLLKAEGAKEHTFKNKRGLFGIKVKDEYNSDNEDYNDL